MAQTKSVTSKPVEAAANKSQAEVPSFSLSKLKSKFKIRYFGQTLGPTLKKWDDNEYLDDGTKDIMPMTLYNSFNVRYLLTERFNLFVSPRMNMVIGDRNDLKPGMEQNTVYSDDWQFGLYYIWFQNKDIQYAQRYTHRQPFSKKSQFENIESQIEWQHDITWAITPAFRYILWHNYRYYAYNSKSTTERYRINWTSLFNYSITDKWLVQYMHELDLQHRNPKDKNNPRHRDFNYMKPYHHYSSFGIGYSPIPDWTFIPFIRIMDHEDIRNETMMVGLTILGKVI